MKQKYKNLVEFRRKVFHILSGTALAYFFYKGLMTKIHFVYLSIFLFFLFGVYVYVKFPLFHDFMLLVDREKDLNSFPGVGALFFVVGMTIAVWLFSQEIATAAILILAWGDGMATLVGPYGKHPYFNRKKMWEGLIAGMLCAAAAASFVVPFSGAVLASVIAMLVEGLDPRIFGWQIDDNLFVPLIAGVVLVLVG